MDEQENEDIDINHSQGDDSASPMESTVLLSVNPPQAVDEVTHDDNSAPPGTDSLLHDQRTFGQDVDQDIVVSVLKAFELLKEMNGSQKKF